MDDDTRGSIIWLLQKIDHPDPDRVLEQVDHSPGDVPAVLFSAAEMIAQLWMERDEAARMVVPDNKGLSAEERLRIGLGFVQETLRARRAEREAQAALRAIVDSWDEWVAQGDIGVHTAIYADHEDAIGDARELLKGKADDRDQD